MDHNGFLVRDPVVDSALQKLAVVNLRTCMLSLCHDSVTVGNPDSRRMYYNMWQSLYWPHMSNDVYKFFRRCCSCIRNQAAHHKQQKHLHLFQTTGTLEFVAIDIHSPLPKTMKGNKYDFLIMYRFSKLTREVAMTKDTAPHMSTGFFD